MPLKAAAELAREDLTWPRSTRLADRRRRRVGQRDRAGLGRHPAPRAGEIAVYRDAEGVVHERVAACPQLGCIVQWNPGEKTWDCPATARASTRRPGDERPATATCASTAREP